MKREELFDAFSYIDEQHLQRAENAEKNKHKPKYKRFIAIAACLCIIVTGAFALFKAKDKDLSDPIPPFNDVQGDLTTSQKTSDTYSSLEELLAYLKNHDSHSEAASDGRNGNTSVSGVTEAKNSAQIGNYIYQIDESLRFVSVLKSENGNIDPVSEFNCIARYAFTDGNNLILVGDHIKNSLDDPEEIFISEDEELVTDINVYSLSDPESPVLTKTITQSGELSACYMWGGELFLLTSDGQCACGWSRLQDTSGYVPSLSVNGEDIPWGDENISILGEPTMVQYTAVTSFDTVSLELKSMHAYYGNIGNIFYGDGWLSFTTADFSASVHTQPEIYTFSTEDGLKFTGKLDTAELLGIKKTIKLKDGRYPKGTYASVISLTKVNNEYRIIGTVSEDGNRKLLSVSAIMENGSLIFSCHELSDNCNYSGIDEVLWEDDRVILSLSVWDGEKEYNRFVFIEFSDTEMILYESDLTFDHVAGVDMIYWLGSPLGEIESLIPLGDGIYIRYNGIPNGLDVYDFSDSGNAKCIYKSESDLPERDRYEFINAVYNDRTFGVMSLSPDESGDYRNLTYTWRVYRLDLSSDTPLTMLSETPLTMLSEHYSQNGEIPVLDEYM